jgi:hypothetical protein
MKPTKQQIAEARKRGIVPGARIRCSSGDQSTCIVPPYSKWYLANSGNIQVQKGEYAADSVWAFTQGDWATVIAAPTKPSQPRIKGRFAAKPKEQPDRIKQIELDVNRHGVALATAVDRIEGYLNKVGQAVVDQRREFNSKLSVIEGSLAVIRSGATFMQQLEKDAPGIGDVLRAELRPISERLDAMRFEQYALVQPKKEDAPQGLQPGDYCDASKEVADELTAMGLFASPASSCYAYYLAGTWYGELRVCGHGSEKSPAITHLDAPTFLARARVTAKEQGLKPVVDPKEGDYVRVVKVQNDSLGKVLTVKQVRCQHLGWLLSNDCWYAKANLEKLSEAEIAAHLAAEAPQVDELQNDDACETTSEQRDEVQSVCVSAGIEFDDDIEQRASCSNVLWNASRILTIQDKSDWLERNWIPFPEFRRRLLGTIARRKEAQRAEKLKALQFGVRVKAKRGEGVYWKKVNDEWHDITFPDGWASCSTDELTILP